MKTNFLLFALFTTSLFVACEKDPGINQVEVILDTEPFDRIRLISSSNVRIIQADHYQVTMTGFRRDIDDIDVKVINEKLTIEEHGNHPDDLVIKIFVPEIEDLDCSGSSFIYGESSFQQNRDFDINLEGSGSLDFAISTNDIDLSISGSAEAYLEGNVQNLDAELTGSGALKGFNLVADFADIRTTGSGYAEVNVVKDLDAFILGSGGIYYKGHPQINADITGSGRVIDAN